MKPWKNIAQAHRRRLQGIITAGMATCTKCGRPVVPGQAWDVDHLVERDRAPHLADAPANMGIAHRSCNRSSGAAYGNAKRSPRVPAPPPPSRPW